MAHSGEQNGPFCDVKRPILKKQMFFSAIRIELFSVLSVFLLQKRKKIPTGFFGKKNLYKGYGSVFGSISSGVFILPLFSIYEKKLEYLQAE